MTDTKTLRRTPQQWQQLLAEFESGSLTAKQFCTERNLSCASFYQWRKRGIDTSRPTDAFVDLSSLARMGSDVRWHIELDLGDGLALRIRRA